jgi:hypothetical protein
MASIPGNGEPLRNAIISNALLGPETDVNLICAPQYNWHGSDIPVQIVISWIGVRSCFLLSAMSTRPRPFVYLAYPFNVIRLTASRAGV